MKINFIGDLFANTGYGSHSRQLCIALIKEGVQVRSGFKPVNYNEFNDLVGREACNQVKKINKQYFDFEDAVTLLNTLPPFFIPYYYLRSPKVLGYCVFEGSRVHVGWDDYLKDDKLDKILVPSVHTRRSLPEEVLKKTVLCPHGVNTDLFKPEGEVVKSPSNSFKFLFVGGWKDGPRDRKGLDLALKAFTEEFGPDEDVEFVVKHNPVYGGDVLKDIKSLGFVKEKPVVRVVKSFVNYTVLPSFYRMRGCLVSPSKGESFGLHLAEALACGMPVISTRGSGWLSNYDNVPGVYDVGFSNVPATGERHIYECAQWSLPNVSHLRRQMRYVYENESKVKERALKGSKFVQKNLTWQETARIIKSLM